MHITENITPEQQQDHFILSFVQWLDRNYVQCDHDAYARTEDMASAGGPPKFTSAQCLDLFRKMQIPPLPLLSSSVENQTDAVIERALRNYRMLYGGYEKIMKLIHTDGNITKKAINDIIIDTMTHIANS